MTQNRNKNEIKKAVKEHYANAIKQSSGSCCGGGEGKVESRFVQMTGYSPEDFSEMPSDVTSFGCGNPVNFIEVKEGDTVLDLGSGSGLDLILASRKVGPKGKVIGLDMTPEMIETCRKNLQSAGVTNGEVRQGEMEAMPVADGEVDWIISNCVINLSPEKEKVFAESLRVLKPGGKVLISDIVTNNLPDIDRQDITAWVGCIAGAVEEDEYISLMEDAGFIDVQVIDKMVYSGKSLAALASDCGCGSDNPNVSQETIDRYAGKVATVKVSARKPE